MQFDFKRFLKYCVAGGSATVTDFVVLSLLVYVVGMNHLPWYVIAATISFLTATGVNFSISWNWVFKDRKQNMKMQFIKFFVVTVVGILLNNGIIVLMVEKFHWPVLFGKVLATAIIVFYNFIANNLWAFKSRSQPVVGSESGI